MPLRLAQPSALLFLAAAALAHGGEHGLQTGNIDHSTSPCRDFFQYAVSTDSSFLTAAVWLAYAPSAAPPTSTGSPTPAITMGIDLVAFFAATATDVPPAKITSTFC